MPKIWVVLCHCGDNIAGTVNIAELKEELSKAGEKLKAVQERGFDALTIVCPLGGRVLDSKQERAAGMVGEKLNMPVFYLTQLVGLSMGMEPESLGLHLNRSPVSRLIK